MVLNLGARLRLIGNSMAKYIVVGLIVALGFGIAGYQSYKRQEMLKKQYEEAKSWQVEKEEVVPVKEWECENCKG